MKPLKPTASGGTTPAPEITSELRLPEPQFVGEAVPSLIHPHFRGVHLTAGFFGSGKTTIHLGTDVPDNVLFIDMEVKGRNLTEQVGLANYFAPVDDAATVYGMDYKPRHLFQRVTQILKAIPQGRFTTVIIDGLTILQEGLLEEVKANAVSYGVRPDYALSGKMGGAWPGVSMIFQKYFNMLKSKGVQVIGITTELKSKWSDQGPILNKFEVKGVGIINKYSILTGITLPGDAQNLGAPAGLISKEQLGQVGFANGQLQVVKRLPPKMPLYAMREVYRYLDKPANWMNLDKREIPSEDETSPYSAFVGKDQMGLLKSYLDAIRSGALKVEDQDED